MKFVSDVLALFGTLMVLLMVVVVSVLLAHTGGLSRNHLISYGWNQVPNSDPWQAMPTPEKTEDDKQDWDDYSWLVTANMDSDPVKPLPKPDNN